MRKNTLTIWGEIMGHNNIDFFVTGGARSGTTYLYNLLASQDSLDMSSVKETNYYLDSLSSHSVTQKIATKEEYLGLFRGKGVRGEASPFYFFDDKGLRRLKNENPNVKVLLILRNPVNRAFSHYSMDKYKYGFNLGCFLESLEGEFENKLIEGVDNNYRDMSMYSERVRAMNRIFGPDYIKVVIFEDLIREREKELSEVLDFLGVEASGFDFDLPKNESVSTRGVFRIIIPYIRSGIFRRIVPKAFVHIFKSILFKPGTVERLSSGDYIKAAKFFEEDVKVLETLVPGVSKKWGFSVE